jgi:hypothetical protein
MSRGLADSSNPEVRLAALMKRGEALEREQPARLSHSDGTRIRSRLGLQLDGKYGLRVWNTAGTVVFDQTT